MQQMKEKADNFYKNKKWAEAVASYYYIVNKQYENIPVEVYAKLAIAQRFVKDYSGSEETLKKGLEEFPENTSLLIEYAALENNRKNWKEALALWEKAKNKSEDFSTLNYQRYSKAYLMLNENNILKQIPLTPHQGIYLNDLKYQNALIENINTRIREIRNDQKDKSLALKYVENAISFFSDNTSLLLELAISYMHMYHWDKAIVTFETILYHSNYSFDSHNYNRLAKCYEMANKFDNYEALILDGMKRYSTDENLHFRYIYATCLNDLKENKFDHALKKINLLLGTNKPDFWAIDKKQLYYYRNECISKLNIKSINSSPHGMSVIANRSDGLGERLNAILNGIILAKTFNYKFGYIWKDNNSFDHLQGDTKSNTNLVGHAVAAESTMFSDSFISTYSQNFLENKKYRELSGKNNTYKSIYDAEVNNSLEGWISPRLGLKEILSSEQSIEEVFSYKDAFSFIEFSDSINYAINRAKSAMNNKKYIALHLRSGDVFYGQYRKFVHYTYKGIVLPLAKAIIEKHLKEGIEVIVFGQDLEVLNYLKNSCNITTVEDFDVYSTLNDTQKAMFEIVLMSDAESIIAGSSGFAKLASWIGGKDVKSPANYYNAKEQVKIIKNDLEKHGKEYPKLQTSFAYWYAYYYGRHSKSLEEATFFLSKAYEYDPENELYPLVLASLQYKFDTCNKAEETLNNLFNLHQIYDLSEHPSCQILSAKTMGKLNLLEFIPNYEESCMSNTPFASLVMYIITLANDAKSKKKTIYLENIIKHSKNNKWLENFYLHQKNILLQKDANND